MNALKDIARQSWLIARKDLLIERRAKVLVGQIIPFGIIVLLLFVFALDPDRGVLARVSPGLFWVAILLALLLAVNRSAAIETKNSAGTTLRLTGIDPAAVFLGKVIAICLQLLVLELVMFGGIFLFFNIEIESWLPVLITLVPATIGLAATGTVYGVLISGLALRETLIPILLLPVVTPVMLGATQSFEAAFAGINSEAWPWIQLLTVFAVVYLAAGTMVAESLMEDQ